MLYWVICAGMYVCRNLDAANAMAFLVTIEEVVAFLWSLWQLDIPASSALVEQPDMASEMTSFAVVSLAPAFLPLGNHNWRVREEIYFLRDNAAGLY